MQYLLQILHLSCQVQRLPGFSSDTKWLNLRFRFWEWIMWKMYNKTIIEFGFRMISWIIKTSCLCYLPQPSASADNTDLGFDNSWYHAQPHPIIVYCVKESVLLGTKPLVDSIRHFIRDPSGVFSVCRLCECRIVQWRHDSRLLLLFNI